MTEKQLDELAQKVADLVVQKMTKIQEDFDAQLIEDMGLSGVPKDVKIIGPADSVDWASIIMESIKLDEEDLAKALEDEDYELAARLRNNINKLKAAYEKYHKQ